MVSCTQCPAWSDQLKQWSGSRAAAPKGRCPVGYRGEFPYVRLSVRLSVCPSVRLSFCPSVCLSVCLSRCLFAPVLNAFLQRLGTFLEAILFFPFQSVLMDLSISLVYFSIILANVLSIKLSISMYTYIPIDLSICKYMCIYIHIYIYISAHIYI